MIKLKSIVESILNEETMTPEKAAEIFLMFGVENALQLDKNELEKPEINRWDWIAFEPEQIKILHTWNQKPILKSA